jgi:predicted Zn-dependent peptidase
MREHYSGERLILCASGRVDHDQIVELASRAFVDLPHEGSAPTDTARYVGGDFRQARDLEQVHLVLGFPGVGYADPDYYAATVYSTLLGGGMSSRLFQEIRERRGLAYSVYSYTNQYADSGTFGVYAGCTPGKADEVLALTREELARVAERGVTDEEISRGKGMLQGSLVLGLEDTGSRMSRLGKGELLYDELLTVDQVLAAVDAVTPDEVRAVAREIYGGQPSLAVIGPFADHDFSGFVRAVGAGGAFA